MSTFKSTNRKKNFANPSGSLADPSAHIQTNKQTNRQNYYTLYIKVYSVQCTLYTVHTVYICTLYTFSACMFRITMTLVCTISIGRVFNRILNLISVSSVLMYNNVLMYNKCYNQGSKSRGDGGIHPSNIWPPSPQ